MTAIPSAPAQPFNPWLSIWFHPRRTMRSLIDENPRRHLLLVVFVVMTASGFNDWIGALLNQREDFRANLLLALLFSLTVALGVRLIFTWMLQRMTGPAGRRVPYVHLFAASMWAELPSLLVFAAFAVEVVIINVAPRQATQAPLGPLLNLGLALASLIGAAWTLVLCFGTLAETMHCSYGEVLKRGLLATLIMLPFGLCAYWLFY